MVDRVHKLDEQLRQGGNGARIEELVGLLRKDTGKLLHGRDRFFDSLDKIQSLVSNQKTVSDPPSGQSQRNAFSDFFADIFSNAQKPAPNPSPTRLHDAQEASKEKTMRDQVFISYSHKDEQFLNELQTQLKPLVRTGSITVWSDKDIQPGSKFFDEIKDALAKTWVAVLLVSPDFLASDFIHDHELGPLLKEAESGNVKILWIPIRACAYKETPLKDYQALSPPEKAFAEMGVERDSAWVAVCEGIKKALNP